MINPSAHDPQARSALLPAIHNVFSVHNVRRLSARHAQPQGVPDDEITAVALAIKRKQRCHLQGSGPAAAALAREAVRNAGRNPVWVDLVSVPRPDGSVDVHVAANVIGQAAADDVALTAALAVCDRWSALVVTVHDARTQGRALAALAAIRDRVAGTVPLLIISAASPMAIRAIVGTTLATVALPAQAAPPLPPAVALALRRAVTGPDPAPDPAPVTRYQRPMIGALRPASPGTPPNHVVQLTAHAIRWRTAAEPSGIPAPPVFQTAPYRSSGDAAVGTSP